MFHVRDITRGCCEMPRNAAKKMLRWHSLVTTPLKFLQMFSNAKTPPSSQNVSYREIKKNPKIPAC